ncbi:hypothetical protein ACFPRL_26445 [Pseudoclavibacter helvolus]
MPLTPVVDDDLALGIDDGDVQRRWRYANRVVREELRRRIGGQELRRVTRVDAQLRVGLRDQSRPKQERRSDSGDNNAERQQRDVDDRQFVAKREPIPAPGLERHRLVPLVTEPGHLC